jgi:AcrR family transcriptional regulator
MDPVMEPTLRRPAPELGPRALRTVEQILAATKQVLLSGGYHGTSIDDIARAAGVSRASFYTYFPSKRDALLAVGAESSSAFERMIDRMPVVTGEGLLAAVTAWIAQDYFTFLDDYGSYVLAWADAAQGDSELRSAGMRRHLAACRHLGLAMEALRGSEPFASRTQIGLLVSSMMERSWWYRRLYGDAIPDHELAASSAAILVSILGS